MLLDEARKDLVVKIHDALIALVGSEKLADCSVNKDTTGGTMTVDDIPFGWADGRLRVMGFCPKCAQEVPSLPIRSLADIADYVKDFRPMRHQCMDVD